MEFFTFFRGGIVSPLVSVIRAADQIVKQKKKRGPRRAPFSPRSPLRGELLETHRTETAFDALNGREPTTATGATPLVPEFDRAEISASLEPPHEPSERLCAHCVLSDSALLPVTIDTVVEDGSEKVVIGAVVGAGKNADEEEGLPVADIFLRDLEGESAAGEGVHDREDRDPAKDEVEDCVDPGQFVALVVFHFVSLSFRAPLP